MTHYKNTISNYPNNLTVIDKTSDQSIQNLALTIAQAADDRKGSDITVLKVTEISYLTDYFVIITGFSRTQVKAIADAIEEKVYLMSWAVTYNCEESRRQFQEKIWQRGTTNIYC